MSPAAKKKKVARTIARILVVDDEEIIQTMISQLLLDLGYDVLQASNGQEALDVALAEELDLVLLDIMMPDLTGIEVCQRLRANKRTKDLPVIVVSGLDARHALEESIIAGADDFLAKPIYPLELVVRVRSMLRVCDIHDKEKRLEAYVKSLQSLRSPGNN